MTRMTARPLGDFGAAEQGGVTIFGLFFTLVLLIIGGIAVDTAMLISERTKLQIAADAAAEAAMYYRQSVDEPEAIAKAILVAQGTVPAANNPNAIRAEDIIFGVWEGSKFTPKPGSTSAVQVITGNSKSRGTGVATFLLRLSGVANVDLETKAIVAGGGVGGCIFALDRNGTGVTTKEGSFIKAPKCAVVSNATVTTECGSGITTANLLHEGNVDDCPWAESIIDAEGARAPRDKKHTPDPMADNDQVKILDDHFADVREIVWPDPVSVSSGTDVKFGYGNLSATEQQVLTDAGCDVEHVEWNPNWTVTCHASNIAGDGDVNATEDAAVHDHGSKNVIHLGNITTDGGTSVDFSGSDSNVVFEISGTIIQYGSELKFGSGTYNIANGINGAKISFGSGTFHIGGDGGCGYSICDSGTISFNGSGSYIIDNGINIGGGSTLSLGVGARDNYYVIGTNSEGNSITLNGSGRINFGDAVGIDHAFSVRGVVNATGGGSCLVFPQASSHDFAQTLNMSGAAILGSGPYHVDGNFRAGTGGASCGNSLAVEGHDVTLVISGHGQNLDGSCAGKSFCVGQGNAVTLTAPTTGANAFMGVIGPLDGSADGARIEAGGTSKLSGVMYFPTGPIDVTAGAGLSGSSGDTCLQIVGSQVSVNGGSAGASECIDLPASGKRTLVY